MEIADRQRPEEVGEDREGRQVPGDVVDPTDNDRPSDPGGRDPPAQPLGRPLLVSQGSELSSAAADATLEGGEAEGAQEGQADQPQQAG